MVCSTQGSARRVSVISATALLLALSTAVPKAGVSISASKSFGAASIAVGATTTMTISVHSTIPVDTLTYTDSLPAGLQIATPNGLTTSACGAATVTAPAGATTLSMSGGTIAGGATCVVTINVLGVTTGLKNNTTSSISANGGGVIPGVSASITVTAAVPVIGPVGLGVLGLLLATVALIALRRPARTA